MEKKQEFTLDKLFFLRTGKDKYHLKTGTSNFNVSLDHKGLKRLLKKLHSANTSTMPKSKRTVSYTKMAQDIASQVEPYVYCQKHLLTELPSDITESTVAMLEDTDTLNENKTIISSLAKKTGKSVPEVEKLWKKAVDITMDTFGNKEKDFKDKHWKYTVGVLKNSLGLKESTEIVEDFLSSDKSAREFVKSNKGEK